jgi:mxaJ protein
MRSLFLFLALGFAAPAGARDLKVCADPNNLPFSNAKGEGFENRIVEIVARELAADVQYVWHAQRRGNIRETLNAGLCDLIPGVGSSVEMLATTRPYYRSTYVAVSRADGPKALTGFDDERLRGLKLGVQLIGDDGANTPPAHALSRRGIIANVKGYPIYGDYAQPAPQSAIVHAVAAKDIDVAFVWGPTAAFFARREKVPLKLDPIEPQSDGPALPMVFDVSMGVRREDRDLKREVEAALAKRRGEIRAMLESYGVPLVSDQ